MIARAAPIVDWATLGRVVVATLVVGIGVAVVFSVAVWGSVKAGEHARAENRVAATLSGALAAGALLVVAAVIVYGLHVLATK